MPIPIDAVDSFVNDEGEWVKHYTGVRCFCHNSMGQPDINCLKHEQGGLVYVNPKEIIGLITQTFQNRDLVEAGVMLPGDCVFSPLTTDTVCENDKIVFLWPLPFGQGDNMVMGSRDTDILYYEAVQSILCLDEDMVQYTEGVDFILSGKNIVWEWINKQGKKPIQGTRYTIKYKAYIEWIVVDPPMERITHGDDLGSRVVLRKKHILES